jgi:hypothetical protein
MCVKLFTAPVLDSSTYSDLTLETFQYGVHIALKFY